MKVYHYLDRKFELLQAAAYILSAFGCLWLLSKTPLVLVETDPYTISGFCSTLVVYTHLLGGAIIFKFVNGVYLKYFCHLILQAIIHSTIYIVCKETIPGFEFGQTFS